MHFLVLGDGRRAGGIGKAEDGEGGGRTQGEKRGNK